MNATVFGCFFLYSARYKSHVIWAIASATELNFIGFIGSGGGGLTRGIFVRGKRINNLWNRTAFFLRHRIETTDATIRDDSAYRVESVFVVAFYGAGVFHAIGENFPFFTV